MTDLQKAVQALRDALQELEAATAPEPVKPWWDVEWGFDCFSPPIQKREKIFLGAAPLMAKALLGFLEERHGYGSHEEAEARAALKAAGVEIPE